MSGETGYEKPEYLGMLWEGASGRNGEWEPRGGAGWGVRALLMERRGGGRGGDAGHGTCRCGAWKMAFSP